MAPPGELRPREPAGAYAALSLGTRSRPNSLLLSTSPEGGTASLAYRPHSPAARSNPSPSYNHPLNSSSSSPTFSSLPPQPSPYRNGSARASTAPYQYGTSSSSSSLSSAFYQRRAATGPTPSSSYTPGTSPPARTPTSDGPVLRTDTPSSGEGSAPRDRTARWSAAYSAMQPPDEHSDTELDPPPRPHSPMGGRPRSRSREPRSPASSHSHGSHDHHSPSQHSSSLARGQSPSRSQLSHSHSALSQSHSTSQLSHRTGATAPDQPPACASCGLPMSGQFVRALGSVFHLDCFKCQDCGKIVATKFFPIEGPDGRLQPLCETDYFRRLDLICANCGLALRGSYITACGRKYHTNHFTCSVCPTLFGPQDSYYEHDSQVYCHFHYSTRFAVKCTGCKTAILKQFVEIHRNNVDEHWHPECYMINKFWNVKLAQSSTPVSETPEEEEARETAASLRTSQQAMEDQVYRIWTVLSAFEESSAACISEMLRHVSAGGYMEAVRMAEKFILHVEVLFAALDEIERQYLAVDAKGTSHVREARMLCRKTVSFLSLLSHMHEAGARRAGMSKDLLSLVTGLAHYLKILIRIALTGSLKLEREFGNPRALVAFLERLGLLMRDPAAAAVPGPGMDRERGSAAYGYKSLSREAGGGVGPLGLGRAAAKESPTDLCFACRTTVEEDCIRYGVTTRWKTGCFKCAECGRRPVLPPRLKRDREKDKKDESDGGAGTGTGTGTGASAPPQPEQPPDPPDDADAPPRVPLHEFWFERGEGKDRGRVLCGQCATASARQGFEHVTRLEQYAYLLNVALCRLYTVLRDRGVVSLPPAAEPTAESLESFRDSNEIKRMKPLQLDRKLSATARLPRRSTVVESPSGRTAQPAEALPVGKGDSRHAAPATGSRRPSAAPSDVSTGRRPSAVPSDASGGRRPSTPADAANGRRPSDAPPRPQGHSRASPALAAAQLGPPPSRGEASSASSSPPVTPTTPLSSAVIRPPFARNNTSVRIIDEGTVDPATVEGVPDTPVESAEGGPDYVDEEGITLGDIPQLMEAEQAREQRRSLGRPSDLVLMSELSSLEAVIVKHFALYLIERSPLAQFCEMEELLDMIEIKKNTFWGKFFKGGKDKKKEVKKGVFGVPIDQLVERSGTESLLGSSPGRLLVPSFIDEVISAMKQMDMSIEGIFRKNGNIRRLKEVSETLDRDPSSVNFSEDSPVQLAALLKKFLREMPDPLIPFRLYRLVIQSQAVPNPVQRKRLLHLIVTLLPRPNRDTLEVLFVFLKWVASFSHIDEETGSKMDLQNLAITIAPSILYAKGGQAARGESMMANKVVQKLLEDQDDYYTVPEELLPILQDQELFSVASGEITRKDILRRCDAIIARRRPGPGQRPREAEDLVNGSMQSMRPPPPRPTISTGNLGGPASAAPSPQERERPMSWSQYGNGAMLPPNGSGLSQTRPAGGPTSPLAPPQHPGLAHQPHSHHSAHPPIGSMGPSAMPGSPVRRSYIPNYPPPLPPGSPGRTASRPGSFMRPDDRQPRPIDPRNA